MPSLLRRRAWSRLALRVAILASLAATAVLFLAAVSGGSGGLAELHRKAYNYFVAPGVQLNRHLGFRVGLKVGFRDIFGGNL